MIHRGLLVFAAVFLVGMPASAGAALVSISFDTTASGNPLVAPGTFDAGSPLTNAYSTLGVRFSGPVVDVGGYILNDGNFTTKARSGSNFLAFSGSSSGPETVTFTSPMSYVSIYGSCLSHSMTFRMEAFNASWVSLGFVSVAASGAGYFPLSLSSNGDIKSVAISAPTAGLNAWVLDDLVASTTAIPEPGGAVAVGPVVGLLLRRRRG
jgi:hypothetical protein